jgi:hypothetical protein
MLHTEFYIACFFAGRKPFSRRFARGKNYFNGGAGIVADSNPAAEYDETPAKAAGFLAALNFAEVGVQALACSSEQAKA